MKKYLFSKIILLVLFLIIVLSSIITQCAQEDKGKEKDKENQESTVNASPELLEEMVDEIFEYIFSTEDTASQYVSSKEGKALSLADKAFYKRWLAKSERFMPGILAKKDLGKNDFTILKRNLIFIISYEVGIEKFKERMAFYLEKCYSVIFDAENLEGLLRATFGCSKPTYANTLFKHLKMIDFASTRVNWFSLIDFKFKLDNSFQKSLSDLFSTYPVMVQCNFFDSKPHVFDLDYFIYKKNVTRFKTVCKYIVETHGPQSLIASLQIESVIDEDDPSSVLELLKFDASLDALFEVYTQKRIRRKNVLSKALTCVWAIEDKPRQTTQLATEIYSDIKKRDTQNYLARFAEVLAFARKLRKKALKDALFEQVKDSEKAKFLESLLLNGYYFIGSFKIFFSLFQEILHKDDWTSAVFEALVHIIPVFRASRKSGKKDFGEKFIEKIQDLLQSDVGFQGKLENYLETLDMGNKKDGSIHAFWSNFL